MRRTYRRGATEIAVLLRQLISSRSVAVDRPLAEAGLEALADGGDFAGGVISAEARGARCDRLLTFDQGFPQAVDAIAILTPR